MLKWTDNTTVTNPKRPENKDLYAYSSPVPHERLRHVASIVNQLVIKSEKK